MVLKKLALKPGGYIKLKTYLEGTAEMNYTDTCLSNVINDKNSNPLEGYVIILLGQGKFSGPGNQRSLGYILYHINNIGR